MSRLRVALAKEREAKGIVRRDTPPRDRGRAKVGDTRTLFRAGTRLRADVKRDAKIVHLPMVQPNPHPTTRGECQGGPRPCPLVGCRHNLYLEAERHDRNGDATGAIVFTFPEHEPATMPPARSCVLDIADELREADEGLTAEEVAQVLNLTAETVRQIERSASRKMIARLRRLGFTVDDVREALRQAAMDPGRERRRGRHWRPGVQ